MKKIGYKRVDSRASKVSKYLGVSWHKQQQAWQVKFNVNGVTNHFGFYGSELDAASRYNRVAPLYGRPKNKIHVIDQLKHAVSSFVKAGQ